MIASSYAGSVHAVPTGTAKTSLRSSPRSAAPSIASSSGTASGPVNVSAPGRAGRARAPTAMTSVSYEHAPWMSTNATLSSGFTPVSTPRRIAAPTRSATPASGMPAGAPRPNGVVTEAARGANSSRGASSDSAISRPASLCSASTASIAATPPPATSTRWRPGLTTWDMRRNVRARARVGIGMKPGSASVKTRSDAHAAHLSSAAREREPR
jgi:hypothetical protein